MGKMRTKLADQVHILPTWVASCHCPLAQGRISYLVGPRIHTFYGSPSLRPSTAFHPSLSCYLPFTFPPLAYLRSRPLKYS